MNRLAILGASGHGKVLADIARMTGWEYIAFYDDAWPGISENSRWPIIGDTNTLLERLSEYNGVIVGIGDNTTRIAKQTFLASKGASLIGLVHPSANIGSGVEIGVGTVVMASAVINIDSSIGEGCIVNTGAIIDHDCRLSAGVHIGPRACLAGGVTVDESAWVGLGASVVQSIEIGKNARVGAGAVVVKHVPEAVTQVGIPAKSVHKG